MIERKARIAVIVAAWNAEATIAQAVQSALEQTQVSVQVIVVDDASTDDTVAVVREIAARDPRVEVLAQTVNGGPAAARNRALAACDCDFVCVLDSDDAMEPARLGTLLSIAEEGDWDMVADDLFKVPSLGTTAPRQRLWTDGRIGRVSIDFETFVRGNLSSHHGGRGEMGFLKPLMRFATLKKLDLRYDPDMRLGEDYALYATALARGARFCLTDPAGYLALVRPDSLSGRHGAKDLGGLVDADRRIAWEPGLSKADLDALAAHTVETQKKWHWVRLIDAVKSRDPSAALACFAAPLPVVGLLFYRLAEQVVLRTYAALSPFRPPLSKGGKGDV